MNIFNEVAESMKNLFDSVADMKVSEAITNDGLTIIKDDEHLYSLKIADKIVKSDLDDYELIKFVGAHIISLFMFKA